ncbi:MAG: twin-arginine translocase subunit TatC [Cytophagales bacterium]|nr:MAG: twin-arginine translocase subunit TatC [Cytophagales bacterium]
MFRGLFLTLNTKVILFNFFNNLKDHSGEMTFLDHLEDLRWHVVRSVIAMIVFTSIGFFGISFIFSEILLAPMRDDFWTYRKLCELSDSLCISGIKFEMQNRTMTGQFMMHIKTALVFGLCCSFPYLVFEIWKFIKPGLYPKEQKATRGAVLFVSVLFFLGILFGYYIIVPLSFNFLINYKIDESIPNVIDLTNYISLLTAMVLGSGIMFQLPVLIYVLSKIGIVSPKLMRTYRRHAIVVIFIVAAIITPSPDFFTQSIVALPLLILYELSIFISASVHKTRQLEHEEFMNS